MNLMSDIQNIEKMLNELLKIYKFINHPQIVKQLNEELNDETKKKVYELSDGIRSTRDIQKLVGVTPTTITNYWKQWALKGIVVPAERKGRFKAAFDLSEYGLSIIDINDQGGEL